MSSSCCRFSLFSYQTTSCLVQLINEDTWTISPKSCCLWAKLPAVTFNYNPSILWLFQGTRKKPIWSLLSLHSVGICEGASWENSTFSNPIVNSQSAKLFRHPVICKFWASGEVPRLQLNRQSSLRLSLTNNPCQPKSCPVPGQTYRSGHIKRMPNKWGTQVAKCHWNRTLDRTNPPCDFGSCWGTPHLNQLFHSSSQASLDCSESTFMGTTLSKIGQ